MFHKFYHNTSTRSSVGPHRRAVQAWCAPCTFSFLLWGLFSKSSKSFPASHCTWKWSYKPLKQHAVQDSSTVSRGKMKTIKQLANFLKKSYQKDMRGESSGFWFRTVFCNSYFYPMANVDFSLRTKKQKR